MTPEPSPIEVRPAGPADLEALARMRATLWPDGSLAEHREELVGYFEGRARTTLPQAVFVAERAGRLVGFVEVGLRSHADGCDPVRPCGFVEGWFVADEARRSGVGRALVERAEAWARAQGCTELASDTWADNEVSARAHLALGFEVVDRCVNFRKVIAPADAVSAPAPHGVGLAAGAGALRPLGLLGGMSWQSTLEYYRLINEGVAARLGGLHSAPLLVASVDFAPIAELQQRGDWDGAAGLLVAAAGGLEAAGATAIALATNTMHRVAPALEAALRVPLLHIVDPTGEALKAAGVRRAGLLGTRFTVELPFWRERLVERYGIEMVVPGAEDRELVHRVIYDELCRGVIREESRAAYSEVIGRLAAAGAEAVILGCTEIGLLVEEGGAPLPVVDTTALHARAAVEHVVGGVVAAGAEA